MGLSVVGGLHFDGWDVAAVFVEAVVAYPNQSTHSAVAYSTSSTVRQGLRGFIRPTTVDYRPVHHGGTRKGGTGLSASRVRQAHQVIFGVLRYAIRTDRLVKNVAQDIDLPAKQSAPRRYLSHKQLQQVAAKTERFEALTLVLGYCGLRIGEAIALRRKDIGDRTITVRASVTSVTGQGQVQGDTKTHRSREVPVPAFVWERLKGGLPDNPEALVFPSRRGGLLTIGEYRWVFDKAASRNSQDLWIGVSRYFLITTCGSQWP